MDRFEHASLLFLLLLVLLLAKRLSEEEEEEKEAKWNKAIRKDLNTRQINWVFAVTHLHFCTNNSIGSDIAIADKMSEGIYIKHCKSKLNTIIIIMPNIKISKYGQIGKPKGKEFQEIESINKAVIYGFGIIFFYFLIRWCLSV